MATTIRDLFNGVATKVRNTFAIVRDPLYYLHQQGERKFYDVIDRPLSGSSPAHTASNPTPNTTSNPTPNTTAISTATKSLSFPPPLSPFQKGEKIQGGRGQYQKTAIVNANQQWYEGQHLSSHQTVWIREYTLPEKRLSKEQMTRRKESFKHLNQLRFQTGGQDFRIVTPLEAIAPPQDNHCYWITKAIPHSMVLRQYLTAYGAMSPSQVRQALLQILQTLMFLHSQRWLESWRKGIAHGNLSLDSLLIANQGINPDEPAAAAPPPWCHFWIYVTDLLLWQQWFHPPDQFLPVSSIAEVDQLKLKDLQDLGQIAIHLLLGDDADPSPNKLSSMQRQRLATLTDKPLIYFIDRLTGRSSESIKTAEAAYQALLKLPLEQPSAAVETEAEPDNLPTQLPRRLLLPLAVIPLIIGLLGISAWIGRRLITPSSSPEPLSTICCINQVDIPGKRTITYLATSHGSWYRPLIQPGLVTEQYTLIEALQARDPRLHNYQIRPSITSSSDDIRLRNETIVKLQSGELDFVLTRQQENLPPELHQAEVAYDAVVFITAFSDAIHSNHRAFQDSKQSSSPPQLLNGRISFDQIRALYTGEIDDWGAPKSLQDGLVTLYAPAEMDALELFKQKILKADPRRIQRFQQLDERGEILRSNPEVCLTSNGNQPATICSFRSIFRDFESDRTLGIGFAFLSHVYQQCSVYPLASGEASQEVQLLVQANDRPITPQTDLCNDKGSYVPDVDALQSYPLSYPLVVVYPREGERSQTGQWFADMLTTEEGQRLLGEAGFVRLRQLNE